MNDLITVAAAARRLSISNKRVYQMIAEGKLDSLRISPRSIRVSRESVDRFINDGISREKRNLGLDLGPLPQRPRVAGT